MKPTSSLFAGMLSIVILSLLAGFIWGAVAWGLDATDTYHERLRMERGNCK